MFPTLSPASSADFEFCQSLTQRNMAAYRARRKQSWDRARFAENWSSNENFLILQNGKTVGSLHLRQMEDTLEIRDLQIIATHQRRGAGGWVLGLVETIARERGIAQLRLRVFNENPAKKLYKRHGFVLQERQADNKLQLVKVLANASV